MEIRLFIRLIGCGFKINHYRSAHDRLKGFYEYVHSIIELKLSMCESKGKVVVALCLNDAIEKDADQFAHETSSLKAEFPNVEFLIKISNVQECKDFLNLEDLNTYEKLEKVISEITSNIEQHLSGNNTLNSVQSEIDGEM